jgi:uncharacterized protein (DUF697 family)
MLGFGRAAAAPHLPPTDDSGPSPAIPWLSPSARRTILPVAVVAAGGWVVVDVWHASLSGSLTLAAAVGGWWWLSRRRGVVAPRLPSTTQGLIERCEGLLKQFEALESRGNPPQDGQDAQQLRRQRLAELRERQKRDSLELALVGTTPPPESLQGPAIASLRSRLPLTLHWGRPLPVVGPDWNWPEPFGRCDLLLYALRPPLRAADLRWLEALPAKQPVRILMSAPEEAEAEAAIAALRSQLPPGLSDCLLVWSGAAEDLPEALAPLARELASDGRQWLHDTARRSLEQLHADWQTGLETLRRQRWRELVQRTQWVVAAGVFAAPIPSVDLLVLAVANGLMLQEMARLWDCPWSLEQLREAATELGRAALALGVAEWSTQALTGLMRLEGTTWLVGGTLQALSAAYLTRVVARAMADYLALSSGVPEQRLKELRRQAPLLVSQAAETEKLDWQGFLEQGRRWVLSQRTGQPA